MYDSWIDCGDLLNIVPMGMGKWRTAKGRATVASIASASKSITLIWKNHGGRLSWMRELFKDYPHVKVVDSHTFFSDNHKYIFKHGSEYTDWRIWSIGADEVTAFMTKFPVIRNLWYKFCKWRGWLPSALQTSNVTLRDGELIPNPNYQKIVGVMRSLALDEAKAQDMPTNIYFGHSHEHSELEHGNCKVVNLANRELLELNI